MCQSSPARRSSEVGLEFSACGIEVTLAWDKLAAAAVPPSRRDFDDLILANGRGEVVWQREASTPRIGNLLGLRSTDELFGWWRLLRHRPTTGSAEVDQDLLRTIPLLKEVDLGGRSTLLFVQSIAVTGPASLVTVGQSDNARLYLAGVTSRSGVRRQGLRVPAVWTVTFALPIIHGLTPRSRS